jgi:ABC-type branched-subunit amino acid transport system ATPase component
MSALLEATDISVNFGGLVALDRVTVRVNESKAVGLIGPNGAGKTTLFNVISGLQRATRGRVILDDHDISALPAAARARLSVRRSFQNLGLMLDQSVATNVAAGLHLEAEYRSLDPILRPWRWRRREAAISAAVDSELCDLDLIEHKDARVADLSFGTARFVELAGLLVARPRLVLLDEPTTGLDLGERERLRGLLKQRPEGQTVLLIAHDAAFVMDLCDWVYVLAGGRILFAGPPEEVRQDSGVIEAYLGQAAG